MKRYIFVIFLSVLSLSILAQDKPAVRKLPVLITVEEVSFSSLTKQRRAVLKEEYIFEYNEKDQLVLSNYEYEHWGNNLILSLYEYDKAGRLTKEKQGIRNPKDKWTSLTETDFTYRTYKGIDYAFARTEYKMGNLIRELRYPLDLKTGLFVNDKAIRDSIYGKDLYNEYTYDTDRNLLMHVCTEPTYPRVRTMSYTYSTVYSPYVCVTNLPIWYSSDQSSSCIRIPQLLITGLYTPIEVNVTTESTDSYVRDMYENFPSKVTYHITKDEDNYPVTIEEYKGNSSENYRPFLLYTFTYELSENE